MKCRDEELVVIVCDALSASGQSFMTNLNAQFYQTQTNINQLADLDESPRSAS